MCVFLRWTSCISSREQKQHLELFGSYMEKLPHLFYQKLFNISVHGPNFDIGQETKNIRNEI
jgi:hypothetical protein